MRIAAQGIDPAEAIIEKLVEQHLIDDFALARARSIAAEEGKRVDQVVTGLGLVSDDDLARAYAEVLSLTGAVDEDFPAEPIAGYEFTAAFLEKARVLPLGVRPGETGESFALAMVDPLDEQAV